VPESTRTICALSAPVTVFNDELMAALTQKLSKEQCAGILSSVLLRSKERLLSQTVRNRRSDAYKAELLARKMADRIRPIPDELAVLLGEKSADTVESADMTVQAHNPDEDFAQKIDIPTFDQYKDVFDHYPYVKVRHHTPYGPLVVVGYCSGRGLNSDKLYRRNCMVSMPDQRKVGFKDLVSSIGMLSNTGPDGTRYKIKAVPFTGVIGVRCWTNYIGEGDVLSLYRYVAGFYDGGRYAMLPYTTETEWEMSLRRMYDLFNNVWAALKKATPDVEMR